VDPHPSVADKYYQMAASNPFSRQFQPEDHLLLSVQRGGLKMMSSSFLNPCFLKVLCELYLLVQWTLTNPNSLGLEGIQICEIFGLLIATAAVCDNGVGIPGHECKDYSKALFLCEVGLVRRFTPEGGVLSEPSPWLANSLL
jgi:hypothetical protein